MEIMRFFKKLFCRHESKKFIPKRLTTIEWIMSQLVDMFGGMVGTRYPVDREVIFFDIILPKNIYTLEISHHEIHHNLWQEKAKKLLKEVRDAK